MRTARPALTHAITHPNPRVRCNRRSQGKKKPFIDKNNSAHFHLVHRSQRDPLAADPEAPQRVLQPAETGQRRGGSQAASQVSSRAWLAEQDLGGFEISDPSAAAGTGAGPSSGEDFSDLGFGNDGYDYGQHLREIRSDGLFIARDPNAAPVPRDARSVVSHASRVSTGTRASRLSKASIQLRGVASDAFESAEELAYGVGGALNEMNAVVEENDEAAVRAEMDPDLWDALHGGSDDGGGSDDPGEIDDDFVLQADRPTELLAVPEEMRRKKKGRRGRAAADDADAPAAADDADADSGGEGDGEEDEYDEDDEDEVVDLDAGEGAEDAAAARKRTNPFYELFGPSDEDEDDEDDAAARPAPPRRKGGGKAKERGGDGDEREERLLDARFSKLLSAEYSDEEIGELDPDDPRVNGADDLHVRPPRARAPHRLMASLMPSLMPSLVPDVRARRRSPGVTRHHAPAKRIQSD